MYLNLNYQGGVYRDFLRIEDFGFAVILDKGTERGS